MFIKGWNVVKYNDQGKQTTRLLLLTNINFYTVAFDFNTKKIDYGHCKILPLNTFDSIDIGCVVAENQKVEDLPVNQRNYAIALYTLTSSSAKINITEEDFKDDNKKKKDSKTTMIKVPEENSPNKSSKDVTTTATVTTTTTKKEDQKKQTGASSSNLPINKEDNNNNNIIDDDDIVSNSNSGEGTRDTEGLKKKYIFTTRIGIIF